MREKPLLAFLLAASAGLQGAYLLAWRAHDPLWDLLVHDAHRYHAWASAWAAGKPFEMGAFSQAPLYPSLVSVVFATTEGRLGAMIVVQLALATAALALVYVSARRAYGPRAGLTAVVLGGLTHALAFYTGRLLPTVLAVFLAALAVERLQAAQCAARPRGWLLAGGALGLAAVARPDLLLLGPASLLLPELRRLRSFLCFVAGCALVVAPVALRNRAVSGEWVLVSTQGGITFWQGNNPYARGGFSVPEGFSGSIATQREEARALAGLPATAGDAAVSRHWFQRGLAFLLEDPARGGRLLARKASLALDAREHGLEYAPHLDDSPLAPLLPVSFGVLFALAAVRAVRRPSASGPNLERPLLLLLAVETAVLLTFYAAGRYRMTALPVLLALAGFGAISLVDGLRTRRMLAPLMAGGVGLVLAYAPLPGREAELLAVEDAGALRDRGEAFLSRGDLARARAELLRAHALAPLDPTLPLDLGKVDSRAGDFARAERSLRQALALAPELAEAHIDLGAVLFLQGRLDDAALSFEEARRLDPGSREASNNLLGTLLRLGRRREAAALARDMTSRGVPIDPAISVFAQRGQAPINFGAFPVLP